MGLYHQSSNQRPKNGTKKILIVQLYKQSFICFSVVICFYFRHKFQHVVFSMFFVFAAILTKFIGGPKAQAFVSFPFAAILKNVLGAQVFKLFLSICFCILRYLKWFHVYCLFFYLSSLLFMFLITCFDILGEVATPRAWGTFEWAPCSYSNNTSNGAFHGPRHASNFLHLLAM